MISRTVLNALSFKRMEPRTACSASIFWGGTRMPIPFWARVFIDDMSGWEMVCEYWPQCKQKHTRKARPILVCR